MTIHPGHLYVVHIADRGSGTVKAIRQNKDGLVNAEVVHGRFKVRGSNGRIRIDGDPLVFNANAEGISVRPLELGGGKAECA